MKLSATDLVMIFESFLMKINRAFPRSGLTVSTVLQSI